MARLTRTLRLSICGWLLPLSAALNPVAMAQALDHTLRSGADGYPSNVFGLNPAAALPANDSYEFAVSRVFTTNKFDSDSEDEADTKSATKAETYGVAAIFNIGAGAGVGLSVQREFRDTESTSTSSFTSPQELMHKDYLGTKLIVELTKEIRAGLLLRYLKESATVVGDYNISQRSSFNYEANLLGYGAGAYFSSGNAGYGAVYMPAMRGKGTILGEEKILTEPGYALIEVFTGRGDSRFGLSYYRWVHKRDDRDERTTTPGDDRTVSINGVDLENAIFPAHAITIGLDQKLNAKWSVRVSLAQEETEFIFSEEGIPGENDANKRMTFYRWRAGAAVAGAGRIRMQAGLGYFTRSTSLNRKNSFRTGDFSSNGSELFLSIGTGL